MAKYLKFQVGDEGGHILIEVDEPAPSLEGMIEADLAEGPDKAGLIDRAGQVMSKAQTLFNEAIETALRTNVETFYSAIKALPHPPSDIEISFGLKATGELSNIAVGKLGTESNYTIKLAWKSSQS